MQVASGLPALSLAQSALLTAGPGQGGGRAGHWAVVCKRDLSLQSSCALLSSAVCLSPCLAIKGTSAACQDPMATSESLLNFLCLMPWNFSSPYPLQL